MLADAPLVLTLPWQVSLSYRNQSINLQNKSVDWFVDDRILRHEKVNAQSRNEIWAFKVIYDYMNYYRF